MDESVIEIKDSPKSPAEIKRQCDSSADNNPPRHAPKHPLLDSVGERFQQNKVEREERTALFHSKREMEKVHSEFLKQNVADPHELARASYAANHWAKKNGIRDSTLQTAKRNTSPKKGKRHSRGKGKKVANKKPVRTSTVTSASEAEAWQGTSENLDYLAMVDDDRAAHNVKYPEDEGTDARYICPVLYCEAEFSSEGALGQHMNLFKHSPCNPCRYIKDAKLKPDPLCFKCPDCDLEFPTKQLCRNHMDQEKHLVFYPPLAISAYICPQCLYLFDTLETCWSHMEESRHHKISFPFKDDDIESDINLPIAVAEEFVQDYLSKCKMVPFHVQCLDCGMDIFNPALFREHQDETNRQHMISALTDSCLTEVFSAYLKIFSCDTCHRLFSELPGADPRHICAGGIIGYIKADQIRTMSEFVKFSALTQIPSLKGMVVRRSYLKVQKVNHRKKHDPSEILHFKVNDRQNCSGNDTENVTSNNSKHSVMKPSLTVGTLPVESKGVKLENDDTGCSMRDDSGEDKYHSVTVKVEPNVNDTTSFELDQQSSLLQSRNVELSFHDSSTVQEQKENFTERYSLMENTEIPVKQEPAFLNESQVTVIVKSEWQKGAEDSKTDKTLSNNSVERHDILGSGSTDLKTSSDLNVEPSTSSGAEGGYIKMESEDSESDDVEIYDEEVSDEFILISDTDSEDDENISNVQGSRVKAYETGVNSENIKVDTEGNNISCVQGKRERAFNEDAGNKDKKVGIEGDKKQIPLHSMTEGLHKSKLSKNQRRRLKIKRLKQQKRKKKAEKQEMATLGNKYMTRKKMKLLASKNSILAELEMDTLEIGPKTSKQAKRLNVTELLENQDDSLISTDNLKKMKNLVFLDLDNFGSFFKVLPHCPSEHSFVWAFYGGETVISGNALTETFHEMRRKGLVYISERCGKTKDATDFALVLTVGKMDERLPSSVTFTIISADKGFCEVVRQMKGSTRSALLINPHEDRNILLTLLKSIVDT